jgi:hypothetical protein
MISVSSSLIKQGFYTKNYILCYCTSEHHETNAENVGAIATPTSLEDIMKAIQNLTQLVNDIMKKQVVVLHSF